MNDPFELWRLLWSTAMSRGLEHIAEAFSTAALSDRGQASSLNLSTFPTFDRVRIELQTMLLLERRRPTRAQDLPVLIVAPYAVHDASIADFAEGHSLARVLVDGGPGVIALTSWKSASAEMRGCGIDAYLSDLNVAIDDLGGRVSLVGLCQGGWLAAAYASRFPNKVVKLVLAGAPIDLAAAESQITRTLASVPPATIVHLVALGGGMVSGALSFTFWSNNLLPEFTADAALQCVGDAALVDKFNAWNERTVDLPGAYFVQTAEWIFRENRLARERLPALGRLARLTSIEAPIFVLAAADDEIVSLPQATAVKSLCRLAKVVVRIETGRHLSLFMGRRTLSTAWRDIAHWLNEAVGARAARAGARQ
jgi:poly(3-hydroxyalkanoate) synthetase